MRKQYSPVVRGEVRHFAAPPCSCVDVRFRSKGELQQLIAALTSLLSSGGEEFDHVHLQDRSVASVERRIVRGATEITFHRPGKRPDEAERLCLRQYCAFESKIMKERANKAASADVEDAAAEP